MYWTNAADEPAAWVGYEADMTDPARSRLRLRYATPEPGTGQPRPVDQQVSLTATRLRLGGLRWWFVDDGRQVSPGQRARLGVAVSSLAGRAEATRSGQGNNGDGCAGRPGLIAPIALKKRPS